MIGQRRVLVLEHGSDRSHVPVGVQLPVGATVLVGREGDLPVGVEIFDQGISRRAASIRATAAGWDMEITNSNGAVVHPWGQPPSLAGRWLNMSWPRIAVRLLNGTRPGGDSATEHWVLLESDDIAVTPDGPGATPATTSRTFQPQPPPALSDRQHDALRVMFRDFLAWPPVLRPEVRTLRATARVLGISESGVQERLSKAREKANALGLQRTVGLTDPEYVYTLVRAGYLPLVSAPGLRHLLP